MNYYELSFLLQNVPTEEKNKILKEIEEVIKKLEGKIEDTFTEKKRFAYPVKKHTEGFLGIVSLFLLPDKVEKLKKELCKNEKVLRILIERKKTPSKEEKEEKKAIKEKITEKPKKKKVAIEKLDEKLDEILK